MNKQIKIWISVVIISALGVSVGFGASKALDKNNKNDVMFIKEEISQEEIDNINNEIIELEKKKDELNSIKNDEFMMLVNRDEDKRVDKTYKSDNLIKSKLPIKSYKKTQYLDSTVDDAAIKMFNDAKKAGVYLYGLSLYRSYEEQDEIYSTKVSSIGKVQTEMYSAPPGASEHQTGLALDLVSNDYTKLEEGFEKTKAFKWLNENSQNYGFILRYQKEKEDITGYEYEPWHYRYVGMDNAKKIKESNMCFEEYIQYLDKQINDIKVKIDELNDKKLGK